MHCTLVINLNAFELLFITYLCGAFSGREVFFPTTFFPLV